MTPPSPISTDPLEVLESYINEWCDMTSAAEMGDAKSALSALQQVRELVEAAKAMDSALEVYDKGPMLLAPSISRAYSPLVAALSPFIPQGTEEKEASDV